MRVANPTFSPLRHVSVALCTAALTSCAAYMPMPEMPEMPRIPTMEEMQKEQQVKSGKAPIEERAATDGIRVVFQTGHAGIISSVAMSADGRYVVSSSWDETAKVWDVASGEELRTITGLAMAGSNVAFVSGAERLIVHDMTGGRLVDLTTGRTLRELGGIASAATAISGNGRYAAMRVLSDAGGRRNTKLEQNTVLSIVDLARDQEIATLPLKGQAAPLTVSNDAQLVVVRRLETPGLFSAETEWQTELWDVTSKKLRSKFVSKYSSEEGYSHSLSPDGRLLATSGLGKIRIYSTADGKQQLELATGNAMVMGSLQFSPDGRLLASFAHTGDESRPGVHIWEIPSGRAVTSFSASAVGFSADGRTLVVGRQSGGAPALRDLQTGKESPLAGGTSAVVDLAVIGDGGSVAAATEFGGVRHWDLRTGQLTRTFDCPGGTGTRSVSASSAGPWLAAACNDGGVHVWNLRSGELLRTLNPPTPGKYGVMATVRFDPSGRRVAVAVNEQLAVWDVVAGRELSRVTLPRGKSRAPMSADAMPGMSEETRQQYAEQLKQYDGMEDWQHGVRALAFHPSGRYVAVGKMDSMTLLVDIESSQVVRQFKGGGRMQQALPQQADASQSAMLQQILGGRGMSKKQKKMLEEAMRNAGQGGADTTGMAMVTSPDSLDDFLDEFDLVGSLAFSPDGKRLFTLGTRGKRVWDVESGSPIEQPRPAMSADMDPNSFLDAIDISSATGRSSGLAVTATG